MELKIPEISVKTMRLCKQTCLCVPVCVYAQEGTQTDVKKDVCFLFGCFPSEMSLHLIFFAVLNSDMTGPAIS